MSTIQINSDYDPANEEAENDLKLSSPQPDEPTPKVPEYFKTIDHLTYRTLSQSSGVDSGSMHISCHYLTTGQVVVGITMQTLGDSLLLGALAKLTTEKPGQVEASQVGPTDIVRLYNHNIMMSCPLNEETAKYYLRYLSAVYHKILPEYFNDYRKDAIQNFLESCEEKEKKKAAEKQANDNKQKTKSTIHSLFNKTTTPGKKGGLH